MCEDHQCQHSPPVFELPEDGHFLDGRRPAGNQLYVDLRARFSTENVIDVIELDRGLVHRLKEWDDPETVRRTILWYLAEKAGMVMERYEDDLFYKSAFSYLDVGVASSVAVLAAYGALPITSCNGGVFGDEHFHGFPLVAFYSDAKRGEAILRAAEQSGMYIQQNVATESPMLWHPEIEPFLDFARALHEALTG